MRSKAQGTRQLDIPDPKTVTGLIVLMFGGWLALEGAAMVSTGQLIVAGFVMAGGWWLRRRGLRTPSRVAGTGRWPGVRRWMRFLLASIPIIACLYVAGYFVLMDRQRPAPPYLMFVRYDSTFRWAPRDRVEKGSRPYVTPWGEVTTWNIIYRPMDRLWFRLFPRSTGPDTLPR